MKWIKLLLVNRQKASKIIIKTKTKQSETKQRQRQQQSEERIIPFNNGWRHTESILEMYKMEISPVLHQNELKFSTSTLC